jgi:hypothetical protein
VVHRDRRHRAAESQGDGDRGLQRAAKETVNTLDRSILRRELDRVTQQVRQDLLEPSGVAPDLRQLRWKLALERKGFARREGAAWTRAPRRRGERFGGAAGFAGATATWRYRNRQCRSESPPPPSLEPERCDVPRPAEREELAGNAKRTIRRIALANCERSGPVW